MKKQINISLEENDLEKLKEWFHATSEDEAVRSTISHVLNKKAFNELLAFEGNVTWEGNLGDMREDRI